MDKHRGKKIIQIELYKKSNVGRHETSQQNDSDVPIFHFIHEHMIIVTPEYNQTNSSILVPNYASVTNNVRCMP